MRFATEFRQYLLSLLIFVVQDFFKRMLLRPLTAGDPSGAEMLRVCVEL